MASEAKFEGIPPFPADLPTVEMEVIPLKSLLSRDPGAAARLFKASQDLGFFQIDLRGDPMGEAMTMDLDKLFDFGEKALTLPSEVKLQYRIKLGKGMLGFKVPGYGKTETGQQDRYEMLNVSQDGLLGNKEMDELPEVVLEQKELLKSHTLHCQKITTVILQTLATSLELPEDTFTSKHSPTKASGTAIRIVRTFACQDTTDERTSMVHHTDFGTVTLLANLLGGLQVLLPGGELMDNDAWRWVRPQPHHLIVNLGDVMAQWTAGALRSNIHRIRHQPGEQKHLDRYSVAVLARPQTDASMKSIMGGEPDEDDIDMTVWEWENYKVKLAVEGKLLVKSRGGTYDKKASN